MNESRLEAIRAAIIAGEWRLSDHYTEDYLLTGEDRPSTDQIEAALTDIESRFVKGEESVPHPYGPCSLVRGIVEGRWIHVKCSYPPNPVVVITAYWPDTEPDEWVDNYLERRTVRAS